MKTNYTKPFKCFTSLFIVGLLIFAASCSKAKVSPFVNDVPNNPGPFADTVKFMTQVQPIIQQNCAVSGCHNAAASGGYVLQNFNQISTNATIMSKTINWESGVQQMPQFSPKLSDSLIGIFDQWIAQGKMNN